MEGWRRGVVEVLPLKKGMTSSSKNSIVTIPRGLKSSSKNRKSMTSLGWRGGNLRHHKMVTS